MKNIHNNSLITVLWIIAIWGCKTETSFISPQGYDLTAPEIIQLPHALDEVSGICFLKGNNDSLYAIEDESGKLYKYVLSSKALIKNKFYNKGDYEDISINQNGQFVVLKSNGELVTFAKTDTWMENIEQVTVIKDLLPSGEYEGIFAKDNKWYVLCKNCKGEDDKKELTIYEIQPANGNKAAVVLPIKVKFSTLRKEANAKKENFHPSCLSFNSVTKEWFVISAVNNKLMVLDTQWHAKFLFELNPSVFKQPEGIAFNDQGDLFVSNEAAGGTANLLRINYRAPVK